MPIGSLVGGLISQGGANAAAGAIGSASNQAVQNAHQTRVLNAGTLSPWTGSGAEAQNLIAGLLGIGKAVPFGSSGGFRMDTDQWKDAQQNAFSRFQASPDYNFRFSEGLKALDRSAAARGGLLSGAQTKAAQEFGGNLGSQEYGNWFSRLMGVSGLGLNASNSAVNSNLSTLGQQNNAMLTGAAGQGAAYQSGANALAGGIMGGLNNLASLSSFTGLIRPNMFSSIYPSGGGGVSGFRLDPNGMPIL